MSPNPEKAYLDLIKAGGKTTEEAVTKIFDQLQPVEPSFLLGEWVGSDFDTGHPAKRALKKIDWAGKTFRALDDVYPVIVQGEGGKRVSVEKYGRARLREIKFRGLVSAAMVYDDIPIIDYFRYVDKNTVAGLMDMKNVPGYHFHLTRRGATAKL
ncbi:hypothetical protein C8R44DRAFT_992701 [Mycena epipterygia]|nr:hypothetical protein C8R44DRAFT_825201 [Mycena epipterygia]KAJ7078668.1 hypothetical protein C8R44DRAFT_992701 [Mycena epipterygia]